MTEHSKECAEALEARKEARKEAWEEARKACPRCKELKARNIE